MHMGSVTTPFGRRPMTLALVKRQTASAEIKPGKTADKWKVFRDASESRVLLGLQDRSLAVLDALLSFYPHNELRQDAQLIVFPSNTQLALRAHGITGATLRRHLALLVDAGLIIRRDSANGKRYARKGGDGCIERAFGFDLCPMLARAEELAAMAQGVAADRLALRKARENLTICRRDVRKLITAAIEERAAGNWGYIEQTYLALVGSIPRAPSLSEIMAFLEKMDILLQEVVTLLENQEKAKKPSTNDAHNRQHIQSSNPESINELEPSQDTSQARKLNIAPRDTIERIKGFPLAMVLRACPQIGDYGAGGSIASWRELMSAAVAVRSMLGVSPSAYQDACEAMGPENAAVAMACILERAGHILSPGGYLRDLCRRTERREFSLGPMLMALLRTHGQEAVSA